MCASTQTQPIPYRFVERLKALPFVDAVYLFGSRARGDNGPRADIDLALDCPKASARDWRQALDIVEDADTLLKIDCVRFDELSEDDRLRDSILREHRILYRREGSEHGR